MNKKLEALIAGFRPAFGSQEDIDLIGRIGRFRKLETAVGNYQAKVKSLQTMVLKQTEREKRLAAEGALLIAQLEKKNGITE
jgi:hypothetical protein